MFRWFKKILNRKYFQLGLIAPLVLLVTNGSVGTPPGKATPVEFRISLSQKAYLGITDLGLQTPVNGRIYVIIARDGSDEPRLQIDVLGPPFWGKDIFGFTPDKWVSLSDYDADVIGYPYSKIAELPPGDYFIQAFLNVYTTFQRADGHVVLMHQDAGDGQWLWESPGNAYSQVMPFHLEKEWRGKIDLDLTEVIQPDQPLQPGQVLQQGNYTDTDWVKYIKIRSDVLSAFWGQDMYIGANILLPKGYAENPDTFYPVIYLQGHFPGSGAPFGFRPTNAFGQFWTSDTAPRFIAVTFRDANPYYDTSYSVDSANVGPYGQSIQNELIPYIETNFRVLREPYARILAGGSTGGWEALAMKVFNPDFYGGTWAWCPDGIDFHYFQLVNVYEHDNAYYTFRDYIQVEQPSARSADNLVRFTIKQENDWERAMGTNDRSGGQWDIWEAVYTPLGPDGYPMPVWDPVTGDIDHAVADYWKNYDLNYIIQQRWAELAPKLSGALTTTVGMQDTYFLEEAVYLFDEFVQKANPPAQIGFDYGFRKPHCWRGASPTDPSQQMTYQEFIVIASNWVEAHRP